MMRSMLLIVGLLSVSISVSNAQILNPRGNREPPIPLVWNDLMIGQNYQILQQIDLIESPSKDQRIESGEILHFVDQIPLDQIRVQMLLFKLRRCPPARAKLTTEMILVQDIYGIQLQKDCVVEVFLENHDLYSPSWFGMLIGL